MAGVDEVEGFDVPGDSLIIGFIMGLIGVAVVVVVDTAPVFSGGATIGFAVVVLTFEGGRELLATLLLFVTFARLRGGALESFLFAGRLWKSKIY